MLLPVAVAVMVLAVIPVEAVDLTALRSAVEERVKTYGTGYAQGAEQLSQLAALAAKQGAEDAGPEQLQEIHEAATALRREIMLAHPLLDFDKLLFLKRSSDKYSHTYAGPLAVAMGGSLCVLSPVSPDGKVTSLVPELEGGLFDRFDLSYDAKKVIFSYKKTPHESFRIYEVDIDPAEGRMIPGSLHQLTRRDAEEDEVRRRQVNDWMRGGFNDMYPCYLPSGKIMFSSTRAQRIVFCAPGNIVTTLYLMDADGKNMRRLSENPVSESIPTMLNDGRVIYTRWEYLDKNLGVVQNLWAMRPDGRGVDHVYKLNIRKPSGMGASRAIPGSQKVVTVGGNHYQPSRGPVVLLDVRRSRRSPEAMHCITPDIPFPDQYGNKNFPAGAFTDPYPFSEKFFLASHRTGKVQYKRGAEYGLCLLDGWGNWADLYRDPEISCFEPMPLRPRRKPPEIVTASTIGKGGKTGTMLIQDVYQGMTGIERGRVKYVRVMGNLEWPWDQPGISPFMNLDPHRKVLYGIAKVSEDGSACFTVPANENVFFQALDKDYMALQEMATYVNLMQGETRSCIGCHEPRRKAPGIATGRPMAAGHPPQKLMPQPGDSGPRMIDFTADIQPILDKHCVGCHSGKHVKGRPNLVNVPEYKLSHSYINLIKSGTLGYRGTGSAGNGFVPPLTHGSHAGKLFKMLREGHPSDLSTVPGQARVKLSRVETIKMVTWVDANAPYWGVYPGAWQPSDKDRPDFRTLPLPVVMK